MNFRGRSGTGAVNVTVAVLNARAVSDIMTEYLAAVDAAGWAEREIAEADQEIDARVYALYGLGEGEIRVVEG